MKKRVSERESIQHSPRQQRNRDKRRKKEEVKPLGAATVSVYSTPMNQTSAIEGRERGREIYRKILCLFLCHHPDSTLHAFLI